MPLTVAARPASLDGCFSSWSEASEPSVVRSQMSYGTVKVRRRTTAVTRVGTGVMRLSSALYNDFRQWYEDACQGGVLPTMFRMPPDNVETPWRFTAPPQAVFYLGGMVEITMTLEHLPEWV